MKTKEIEVVGTYRQGDYVLIQSAGMSANDLLLEFKNGGRAKLIIEIPEKSVSITESQFEEAYNSTRYAVGGFHNPELFKAIKQKLFGTQEEK